MERFVLDGQTDCWLWTGPKINSGYGTFGSHKLAHRASYELFNGPIPDGLEILHGCDVKLCVNPKHLEVGTRVDNMQDAKQKGRNAHGSGHGRSKLTEEEVIEVLHTSTSIGAGYEPDDLMIRIVSILREEISLLSADDLAGFEFQVPRIAVRIATLCDCPTRLDASQTREAAESVEQ